MVYWTDDEQFYGGFVREYNRGRGKHLVEYDDGEEEWLRFSSERLEWPSNWEYSEAGTEGSTPRRAPSKAAKNAKSSAKAAKKAATR